MGTSFNTWPLLKWTGQEAAPKGPHVKPQAHYGCPAAGQALGEALPEAASDFHPHHPSLLSTHVLQSNEAQRGQMTCPRSPDLFDSDSQALRNSGEQARGRRGVQTQPAGLQLGSWPPITLLLDYVKHKH